MSQPVTLALARRWLRPRPRDAHKGSSGRVLVVAGSRGMVGAGLLCASAAARSGAGLVKFLTVKSQQVVAAKRAPLEITTVGLAEDRGGHLSGAAIKDIRTLIDTWRPDVIAAGPGLGVTPAVKHLVAQFMFNQEIPLVLDADGLNALSALKFSRDVCAPLIITPHAGELARLLGSTAARVNADRVGSAKKAAARFRCVCLLKGTGTVITDGRSVFKNTTGNPAMASGGMGDALTGIIAAFWAQDPVSALRAATFGAFVHGLAGDLAVRDFPERSLLASDLIGYLPAAFKKIWTVSRNGPVDDLDCRNGRER